jgi:hypothetical protein
MEQLQIVASRHLGDRIRSEWFSRSHFSDIACFRDIDDPSAGVVIKRILPWHLDTLPAVQRDEVARLFNQSTLHFRELLQQYQVPVAKTYECLYQDGHVFHISSEEGTSAQTCINHDHCDRPKMIGLIVRAIAPLLTQPDPPMVGLDPQLDNFGVVRQPDDELGVVYVDIFPPLCYFEGRHLVHYPNPTDQKVIEWELDRKFRPLGILRRLRFSVLSVDLALEEIFLAELRQALESRLFGQIRDFFESLPDAAIRNGFNRQDISRLIQNIPDEGVDDIREVGMRLASRSVLTRKQFLAEVFDLSRKDPSPGYEEPHAVRFETLKKRLLSLV